LKTATIHLQTGPLVQFRKVAGLVADADLAKAMGMNRTTVWRTLNGQAEITAKFIEGLLTAFPTLGFSDLFEIERDEPGQAAQELGAA